MHVPTTVVSFGCCWLLPSYLWHLHHTLTQSPKTFIHFQRLNLSAFDSSCVALNIFHIFISILNEILRLSEMPFHFAPSPGGRYSMDSYYCITVSDNLFSFNILQAYIRWYRKKKSIATNVYRWKITNFQRCQDFVPIQYSMSTKRFDISAFCCCCWCWCCYLFICRASLNWDLSSLFILCAPKRDERP